MFTVWSFYHWTYLLISLVHHRIKLSRFECSWLPRSLSLHSCLSFSLAVVCLFALFCPTYSRYSVLTAHTFFLKGKWASKQLMAWFFRYPYVRQNCKPVSFCFAFRQMKTITRYCHVVCYQWGEALLYSFFSIFRLFWKLTSSSRDLIYNTISAW